MWLSFIIFLLSSRNCFDADESYIIGYLAIIDLFVEIIYAVPSAENSPRKNALLLINFPFNSWRKY